MIRIIVEGSITAAFAFTAYVAVMQALAAGTLLARAGWLAVAVYSGFFTLLSFVDTVFGRGGR